MSRRDGFSQPTRNAVAARAGWHCSFDGCLKLTVGPSDESPTAVTNIGIAAHISAAAPGGSRYRPELSKAERAGIANAIWLCADHAMMIDRDALKYPVEVLQGMKSRHEAACSLAMRTGARPDLSSGLLAVGPDAIFTGDVVDISAKSWTVQIRHFVAGDPHALISFIDKFSQAEPGTAYVLSNEIGDGRLLSDAPLLSKRGDCYSLLCPIAPAVARTDIHKLGSGVALHPETKDLYIDEKGHIARLSGVDYFPQKVESVLSMQQGENFFAPSAGMRFFEYYERFKGTPWLALLMKLDLIRQAAVPRPDPLLRSTRMPLPCVSRVHGIELLAEEPINNHLPVRVDFDVQGLGRWQRELSIYLPTRAQMDERARLLRRTKPT